MKNSALIAIPVALVIAAGAWYFLTMRDSDTQDLTLTTNNAAAVVATVNGATITGGELETIEGRAAAAQGVDLTTLDTETRAAFRAQALEELISQTLLQQAAKDIVVTDEAVSTELATVRTQFESEDLYNDALTKEGFTEATLREQIANNIRIQMYLDQKLGLQSITATDAEVQAFYDQQKASVGEGVEMPPIDELRDQIEQFVIQQKRQELVTAHIKELYAQAQIEKK